MVLEQLAGQPSRRPRVAAFGERATQRLPLARAGVVARLGGHRLGPARAVRPVGHQPVTQRQRRPAVLVVVGGDARQGRLVTRLHERLVRQHGARATPDVGLPGEPRQRLDLLERVARDPGAQPLAHHRVQVHEDFPAQQIVHRVLTRRVHAHQLGERGLLVDAVVVDVHAGIAREPLVHEVHEVLEQPSLLPPVVSPHRAVLPVRAVAQHQAEQEVQPARRLPERVALDVEDDVAR